MCALGGRIAKGAAREAHGFRLLTRQAPLDRDPAQVTSEAAYFRTVFQFRSTSSIVDRLYSKALQRQFGVIAPNRFPKGSKALVT